MRACACDTASRPCVRTVLCNSAFLLVPPLPSTDSAACCSALFAGFSGTTEGSDFFVPCIIGYGLRPSRCGPGHDYRGQNEDLPVPAQEVCVHAGGLMTTRGGRGPRDDGPQPVAFCMPRRHRHPALYCLRRSIPRLYAPLSTLHRHPHGYLRMTRGQCGSLLLHRNGLPPSTSCRSPGAPWLNPTPHASAVYASCSALPPPHATLASRRPATAPGSDLHRLIAPALPGAFRHSITSSARPRSGSGTVMPRSFAVLRFRMSIYLSGR